MRRWQEEDLLEKICRTSREQKDRIHCVLANIQEEELCDELNLMLCKSAVLERKARKRLEQEKKPKMDQVTAITENNLFEKRLSEETCREETQMKNAYFRKRLDELHKDIRLECGNVKKTYQKKSDRQILQDEIPIRQEETNRIKYALHQNRNAGIFASEMAKEWIDLQEDVLSKLKQYL